MKSASSSRSRIRRQWPLLLISPMRSRWSRPRVMLHDLRPLELGKSSQHGQRQPILGIVGFECRYRQCVRSRLLLIGQPRLAQGCRQSCERANPPRTHVVAWLFNFGFFGRCTQHLFPLALAPLDPVEKPGRHFRSEQSCTDVTRSARLSFHLGPERRCPNCNDISRGRQLFGPENRADCL